MEGALKSAKMASKLLSDIGSEKVLDTGYKLYVWWLSNYAANFEKLHQLTPRINYKWPCNIRSKKKKKKKKKKTNKKKKPDAPVAPTPFTMWVVVSKLAKLRSNIQQEAHGQYHDSSTYYSHCLSLASTLSPSYLSYKLHGLTPNGLRPQLIVAFPGLYAQTFLNLWFFFFFYKYFFLFVNMGPKWELKFKKRNSVLKFLLP